MRTCLRLALVGAACAALARGAFAGDGPAANAYAGQWTLRLGPRSFFVVTIERSADGVAGTIARPAHFQTDDAGRLSEISGGIVTSRIVRGQLGEGGLRFTSEDPGSKDTDDWEMRLSGVDQAFLRLTVLPTATWILDRVRDGSVPAVAIDWDPGRLYVPGESDVPSGEMQGIYDADQKARDFQKPPSSEEWVAIERGDTARREATGRLLAAGELHTGADFRQAAFVFQHGSTSDDYLLAHTLAIVAVARGDASASWIAAASMDRFLHSIGKPQIYGTQFATRSAAPTTQEPYNSGLVPDVLRAHLGVPSRAAQERQLEEYRKPHD